MKRLKKFIKSFYHAFRGLQSIYCDKEEVNLRVESVIGVLVIALGFIVRLERNEWMWIILCCAMVLSLELINSSLEKILDRFHPHPDKVIGNIKDVSAASVLIASIASAIIGILIFLPYL